MFYQIYKITKEPDQFYFNCSVILLMFSLFLWSIELVIQIVLFFSSILFSISILFPFPARWILEAVSRL